MTPMTPIGAVWAVYPLMLIVQPLGFSGHFDSKRQKKIGPHVGVLSTHMLLCFIVFLRILQDTFVFISFESKAH